MDSNERWVGKIDAMLNEHDKKFVEQSARSDVRWTEITAKNTRLEERQQLLELKVQTLATKIGIYASLGAFIGGGAMSLIFKLFSTH